MSPSPQNVTMQKLSFSSQSNGFSGSAVFFCNGKSCNIIWPPTTTICSRKKPIKQIALHSLSLAFVTCNSMLINQLEIIGSNKNHEIIKNSSKTKIQKTNWNGSFFFHSRFIWRQPNTRRNLSFEYFKQNFVSSDGTRKSYRKKHEIWKVPENKIETFRQSFFHSFIARHFSRSTLRKQFVYIFSWCFVLTF